jgi:hypothetical protein
VAVRGITTEVVSKPRQTPTGPSDQLRRRRSAVLNDHIAVSLDLRFYAVNPQEAVGGRPAFPRMTILAIARLG